MLGDLLRSKPKESDGIDNIVVVDNVPQVGPDRQEKLKNVIRKIFEKFGKINREFFPVATEKTKGLVFFKKDLDALNVHGHLCNVMLKCMFLLFSHTIF